MLCIVSRCCCCRDYSPPPLPPSPSRTRFFHTPNSNIIMPRMSHYYFALISSFSYQPKVPWVEIAFILLNVQQLNYYFVRCLLSHEWLNENENEEITFSRWFYVRQCGERSPVKCRRWWQRRRVHISCKTCFLFFNKNSGIYKMCILYVACSRVWAVWGCVWVTGASNRNATEMRRHSTQNAHMCVRVLAPPLSRLPLIQNNKNNMVHSQILLFFLLLTLFVYMLAPEHLYAQMILLLFHI